MKNTTKATEKVTVMGEGYDWEWVVDMGDGWSWPRKTRLKR